METPSITICSGSSSTSIFPLVLGLSSKRCSEMLLNLAKGGNRLHLLWQKCQKASRICKISRPLKRHRTGTRKSCLISLFLTVK